MSATRNTESMAAKHEEFSSRATSPASWSATTRTPSSTPRRCPPAARPREATHQPRPAEGENLYQSNEGGGAAKAAATLTGATSQDVYQGYGKPMQGQENVELRHDGQHTSKHVGSGLAGVGAADAGYDSVRAKGADLPEGVTKGSRGKATDAYPTAEERLPESAETVASERR
ncbi:hypothetical protein PG997_010719 [Apiospora hydei]|uniref:Uncharacterized protein n=1 Tax=Apiospora hydei TaxID=1337664 RepID=A0ABR1VH00_9PEZI